ncbi:MAG TPA: phage holin family protein [Opitutaceae bacterium]|nr:phage holin family protein [Opitutaceae bacterium]
MNSDPTSPGQPNSIPHLLRDLRDETTTLLRQEVALAKTELKANTSRMASHAVHIAVGGFVAYAGIIVLLIGIGHLLGALLVRFGLDRDVATWLAPTLVGLVVAVIGWTMLAKAKAAIAHDDLVPRRTIDSLRSNKEWAQNKLQPSP